MWSSEPKCCRARACARAQRRSVTCVSCSNLASSLEAASTPISTRVCPLTHMEIGLAEVN
eukprot:2237129-Rhodomonas_salina.1